MRLRADSLSPGIVSLSLCLMALAVASLVLKAKYSEDMRFLPAEIDCGCECNVATLGKAACLGKQGKFEVRLPAALANNFTGGFFFPRIVVPNNSGSMIMDFGVKLATHPGGTVVPSDQAIDWTNSQIRAICNETECVSDIVHRIFLDGEDVILKLEIDSAIDNENKQLWTSIEKNSVLRSYFYESRNGFHLSWVKLFLLVISLIFFLRFIKSLRPVRIQDRLTVQMFTKYIGFLAIFFNIPIMMGQTRMKAKIPILIMLTDCLFFSYLAVFFLIMMPSLVKEPSTAITQFNTAWKKLFLLVYFLTGLSLKLNYTYQIESEAGKDRTSLSVHYLRMTYFLLTIFWLVFSLVYGIKGLLKMASLEVRSKVLLLIAIPSSLLAASGSLESRSQTTQGVLHIGLTLFVVSLEILFSRIEDVVDGQTQTNSASQQIEILGGRPLPTDSIGHTEDSREDTEGNFYNKSIDDNKPVPPPENEEISYEIENQHD